MNLHLFCLVTRQIPIVVLRGSMVPIVILVASFCSGCGFSGGAPRFDEGVARSSLTKVLDTWQQGQASESLQQETPRVIVGDARWSSGAKLVNYQILGPHSNDGSNLHVTVELELEDGSGRRFKKPVEYIVGTSPQITVFSQEPDES